MMPNKGFLVRVSCMTYNHALFIEDAMRGFSMQQTNFPFVATIVDDASTDGAQQVIQKYLGDFFEVIEEASIVSEGKEEAKEIFAQHRNNSNCFFAVVFLRENYHKQGKSKWKFVSKWVKGTKYTAICEGDDFWSEPTKLQRQVDFLEANDDYAMCFHKINVLTDIENDKYLFSYIREGDYADREVYRHWIVPTCSVVYRRTPNKPFEKHPSVVFSDIFLWLQLAERGKLYCMGFIGATYRRHQGSASCGYSVETSIRLYRQYKFFEKRFPKLKDISRRKQEEEGLADIIKAPYFPGIWKYRFLYMMRHRRLFFSSFFVETLFDYTPIRNLKFWKKK